VAKVDDRLDAPHDIGGEHHSAAPYVIVWLVLLAFTALTVWTGKLHLGRAALPIALAIATTKAALVVLWFMHMRESRGAIRLVFATSIVFVALLLGLTLSDVATRFRLATPRGAPFGSELSGMGPTPTEGRAQPHTDAPPDPGPRGPPAPTPAPSRPR
jgi:cytochrome c oxidase subunit IV